MITSINHRLVAQSEEQKIRKWLINYDDELALHSQLKNYFLSGSPTAGIAAVEQESEYKALCFYSFYDDTLHIHNWYNGDSSQLTELLKNVEEFKTCKTAYAFFGKDYKPSADWNLVFAVTPGFVIDHSAYSGVFSRSAPRALGGVYEKRV